MTDTETKPISRLCPLCQAPWTDEMLAALKSNAPELKIACAACKAEIVSRTVLAD